uniref:Uncharacterized protein n=1 Tax=Molossus molossus TaxID=27622 RepID=A0A7J8DQ88_MOLMO|nr:hypothetical protein HJG59_009258 [Molossus molossus]
MFQILLNNGHLKPLSYSQWPVNLEPLPQSRFSSPLKQTNMRACRVYDGGGEENEVASAVLLGSSSKRCHKNVLIVTGCFAAMAEGSFGCLSFILLCNGPGYGRVTHPDKRSLRGPFCRSGKS